MSTTTDQQQTSVSLENKYCVDYKSPAFIIVVIVIIGVVLASIGGALFMGKRSAAPKMQGGSSKGMISITEFLKSMK